MGLAELDQALALVRAYPGANHFVGPRDERLVAAAEAALGLTFPPTYRRFLRELGAGSVDGEEFYGVIHADFTHSGAPDAVWLTLKTRSRSSLPPEMVVVYGVGNGEDFVLDTSRVDAEGECPVVVWEAGITLPRHKWEVVAPDFGTCFLATVKEALGIT